MRQHFGYRKHKSMAYDWLEQHLRSAKQQQGRANNREEEMLYHVHTEEISIAYLVYW
jgi:hypothetical protein